MDTNVLSALWSNEATAPALIQLLGNAKSEGALLIAPVVYCELLAYPGASEVFVNRFIADTGITVDFQIPQAIWLEAGQRFARYARRRRPSSGQPRRLLADFLIGAHALLQADRLMTLDPTRYKRDFPELTLIPA